MHINPLSCTDNAGANYSANVQNENHFFKSITILDLLLLYPYFALYIFTALFKIKYPLLYRLKQIPLK